MTGCKKYNFKRKIFLFSLNITPPAIKSEFVILAAAFFSLFIQGTSFAAAGKVLFEETFEDTSFTSRGWYDSPQIAITYLEHIPGSGHSCVCHWRRAQDVLPLAKGGRVQIAPVESITLSYYVKHSSDWIWTGVDWHPHEFQFLTNADGLFTGPAFTYLTLYVEAVNGRPRLAIQDGANIDQTRIGQNLVGVTENRAVAGGNGDTDRYKGGYYLNGDLYWNGKDWDSDSVYFRDEPGPDYKSDWHHILAYFKLNSVVNGKGVADGVLRCWYDGKLVINHPDVFFRTGRDPNMKINQFLMLPYYGPGVPHEQSIWIDDLRIVEGEELPPKTCDFNEDGRINILDFIFFLLLARQSPDDPRLDWNGDGFYSVSDAVGLLMDIIQGKCPGAENQLSNK